MSSRSGELVIDELQYLQAEYSQESQQAEMAHPPIHLERLEEP